MSFDPLSFLNEFHGHFMDAERMPVVAFAIILALIIGIITGPMHGNANPFLWFLFDKTLGPLGKRLDKDTRRPKDLQFRGLIFTIFCIVLLFFIGKICRDLTVIYPLYGLADIFFIAIGITCGTVWYAALKLYFALDKEKKGEKINKGAYLAISRSTRVNLNVSDNYGIARIGLDYLVRSFDKGVVAPAIWYLIGGLPLMFVYNILAALAWRFGRDGFSRGFGSVPLALEKLMGFVPHILTTMLIALSGVLMPTVKKRALPMAWASISNGIPYAQGGAPLSVFASMLSVALAGPRKDLDGRALQNEWAGGEKASAKVEHHHLQRGLLLIAIAQILFVLSLFSAYVWAGRFL